MSITCSRLAPANGSLSRHAVCIVGFARTFPDARVFNSIYHAFRRANALVDFYGVVALGSDEEPDTAKGQWKAVPRAALAPALKLLRPVAWVDDLPVRPGPPACHLACMRQYERLEQCGLLIEQAERRCGMRYSTVIKTRPDLAFAHPSEPPLADDTLFKDKAAGDLVVYIPRVRLNEISSLLGSARFSEAANCSGLHPSISCSINGTVREACYA